MADTMAFVTAPYFANFDEARLQSDLVVLPPRESKDRTVAWVRGNLRIRENGQLVDFVVTGPKMRIVYGGCRWNRLVFAAVQEPGTSEFVAWLGALTARLEHDIVSAPDKFRPGSKNAARFSFDHDVAKASSDPSIYPDEIRAHISTMRMEHVEGEDTTVVAVPNAHFYRLSDGGESVKVEPSDIQGGGYMIPIMRVQYYRNVERFGLVLTVLKGLYFPHEMDRTQNVSYEIDVQAMDI